MIIIAPEPGPMIAGFLLPDVNTRESGSHCVATGFASETAWSTLEKLFEWTKMNKARGQGAGNTPTALAGPTFPLEPEGGQAMQKPRPRFYRPYGRPAATSGCQSVAIMTVTAAVARS